MPRLIIPYDSEKPDDEDAHVREDDCFVVRLVDGTRAKDPSGKVKFFYDRGNAEELADELDGIVEFCNSERDKRGGTPSYSQRVKRWGRDADFAQGRAETRGRGKLTGPVDGKGQPLEVEPADGAAAAAREQENAELRARLAEMEAGKRQEAKGKSESRQDASAPGEPEKKPAVKKAPAKKKATAKKGSGQGRPPSAEAAG